MTFDDLRRRAEQCLQPAMTPGEARWTVRLIMQWATGWTPTQLAVKADEEASDFRQGQIMGAVGRVTAGEPVQYVIGQEQFMGFTLRVTTDVLIPRPETEQLTQLIVDREKDKDDLRVLDLCTGSGCIALALARWLPFSHVEGVDVSEAALAVAKDNAATLKARNVIFTQADILTMPAEGELVDIIVSNPPYVMEKERAQMSANVLDHEPALALFVPDDDPLRFYNAVARIADARLALGGRLYLEANPLTASHFASTLTSHSYTDIQLLPDADGRAGRLLSAVKA